uniref:Uncharacterized protein n=1 Tax=Knipowitschia caucasica TaxID=637954 RepID=A0AAV2L1R8_KNICA
MYMNTPGEPGRAWERCLERLEAVEERESGFERTHCKSTWTCLRSVLLCSSASCHQTALRQSQCALQESSAGTMWQAGIWATLAPGAASQWSAPGHQP